MSQNFQAGDYLIFQIESGYGLLRILAIYERDDERIWHLAAYNELFFDIEVDPMRGICYLHGFVERHNGDNATERFVPFLAEEPTLQAERDAFTAALDYLAAHADAAVYYYSKYERTIYRKLQQKYPAITIFRITQIKIATQIIVEEEEPA